MDKQPIFEHVDGNQFRIVKEEVPIAEPLCSLCKGKLEPHKVQNYHLYKKYFKQEPDIPPLCDACTQQFIAFVKQQKTK